ncbi:MAG: VOC family protein, partial [Acidimicrobiales bacterium]
MTRARFNQVNIVVSDMARSVAFYELLGADVADIIPPWADHHR